MLDIIPKDHKNKRIAYKNIFFTYSQCDISKNEMLSYFQNHTLLGKIDKYIIAEEEHKDGGKHIHALLCMEKAPDIKNMNAFDINVNGKIFHPNFQRAKSVNAVRTYCEKDGDYISNFDDKSKNDKFYEELKKYDTNDQLKILKEFKYKDCIKDFDKYERNIKRMKEIEEDIKPKKYTINMFTNYDWMFNWNHEKYTLVLKGESGYGKTQFFLTMANKPLLCSDINDLKNIEKDTDLIIFDDMTFKKWEEQKVIHLLDLECDRSINIKYSTAKIPKGLPRVILTNKDWNDIFPSEEKQLTRRCFYHELKESLIKTNNQVEIQEIQ